MTDSKDIQNLAINTIRFLSADAVQKANSGHPGMPMGAAAIGYTLWMRHLRFNPRNPSWPNRDRFVLSGGHGSMLLYSLLHLTGYDLSLDDIRQFRQWESKTPGHPECFLTPGVEVTTGPLGQGVGNTIGMAIAEAHLAAIYNRPEHEIINHFVYAIVTDGDLMEGISYEAASLAGHFRLGKLILLYDDNRISIDGSTDLTFTEDRAARFEALGWQILNVQDGNNVDAIDEAIQNAKADPRPSLILCRTHIGFGLPTKQDTSKAHGEPAGEEEIEGAKRNLGWPLKPEFHVPEKVYEHFRQAIDRGEELEKHWIDAVKAYSREHPELAAELRRRLSGELPDGWDRNLPVFETNPKGEATRTASGKVINALAPKLPELIGGSADLTGSNKTWISDSDAFQVDNPQGRNLYWGIREHSMAAAVNGMAAHGGLIPYCSTFLVFSDYMRPAIRLSALSRHPSIWVFTHDSIGLGEDGPTHQPIEHLASLRAIPGLVVIRPCDSNEVTEAWRVAVARRDGPTLLSLTRQKVPVLDRAVYAPASGLAKGAYVLADLGRGPLEVILMATGSEVALIKEAGETLSSEGINVRLVSFPSWELFEAQSKDYQESVLPSKVTARVIVEAGVSQGWEKWVGPKGAMITMDSFGVSAPSDVLFEKSGFTAENIVKKAKMILLDYPS
ncbi:MAG: transketolase [Candidatus Thorarchaeota archaeon]|nr:transketolase [Candidatus Thorarchaeota archaeon]